MAQLQISIREYVDRHNRAPKPFQWRATVDEIVAKIQRAAWKVGAVLPWLPLPCALAAVAT